MAVYKIFPEKDTTIFSYASASNAGGDPILEIKNEYTKTLPLNVGRILIKFPQDKINDVLENYVQGSFDAKLKLFTATSENAQLGLHLKCHPISGSWTEGTQFSGDSGWEANGVTWLNRDITNTWDQSPVDPVIGGNGGTYFSYAASSISPIDPEFEVTPFIASFYSASVGTNTSMYNEGFLVKMPDDNEFISSTAAHYRQRYYSKDTHTIYPPHLDIKWDDSVYNTGSLEVIDTSRVHVEASNLKPEYFPDEVVKVDLHVRNEFPVRTFSTSSIYTRNMALPSESYYAIKDLHTNEYVIDFDENYTKISCNDEGNYFNLYMDGLQPERNYQIVIKSKIGNEVKMLKNKNHFKVVNG